MSGIDLLSGHVRQRIAASSSAFMATLAGCPGVYAISPLHEYERCLRPPGPPTAEPSRMMVKVGMSGNLRKRLDNYLLYYPRGFVVLGILKSESARGRRNYAREAEGKIHRYLRGCNLHAATFHTHSGEWFEMKLEAAVALSNIMTCENLFEKSRGLSLRDNGDPPADGMPMQGDGRWRVVLSTAPSPHAHQREQVADEDNAFREALQRCNTTAIDRSAMKPRSASRRLAPQNAAKLRRRRLRVIGRSP